MHSFTARSPRHNFSVVLRRHIFFRPLALKHLPDTPFSAPYPTSSAPSVPLSPFPVAKPFLLPKTYKHPFPHPLTSSPSHLIIYFSLLSRPVLSLFYLFNFLPFYLFYFLFTSLIFFPFTFKNLIFPLPFYLFTLLIFIFSPSCSFPLIVKKYLSSVIFIPIYLSCFHKSINFAEV